MAWAAHQLEKAAKPQDSLLSSAMAWTRGAQAGGRMAEPCPLGIDDVGKAQGCTKSAKQIGPGLRGDAMRGRVDLPQSLPQGGDF